MLKNKFVISLGSNLGDREEYLNTAKKELSRAFRIIEESQIVESEAVDYENQPNFLNPCICLENTGNLSPHDTLKVCLEIENNMGRKRLIDKGPRVIDIDLLFFEKIECSDDQLTIPHPRLFERSFIVKPLSKLQVFKELKNIYTFKNEFPNNCWEFSKTPKIKPKSNLRS